MIKETLALMACVSLGLSPVCVKAEPPLDLAIKALEDSENAPTVNRPIVNFIPQE